MEHSFDTPLHRDRLYEQVAHRIQNVTAAESPRPGDRLPSERDLADRLNVYTSLGHVVKNFEVPAAREIVQRGLLWACR